MNFCGERIVFIGRNTRYAITITAFKHLIENLRGTTHKIVGVVHTDEDDSDISISLRKCAMTHNIETISFKDNDINSLIARNRLKRFMATIFLVVQYPKIFIQKLISIPEKICLNIHRGWPLRGGSIDQRAIFYKQKKYYLILHEINQGIDTGDILYKELVEFDWRHITGYGLDRKAAQKVKKVIKAGFVERLMTSNYKGIQQERIITKYENKWTADRKTIYPNDYTYKDAKRLSRALDHPREDGLFLRLGENVYLWPNSHDVKSCQKIKLIPVMWKDGVRTLPLVTVNYYL